jgi:hypothetical protein
LVLAGEREVRERMLNWDKILRRPRGKRARPKEGFIRVTLSTSDKIELRFNRRRAWFTLGAEGAQTYLRAYGPTRNLPSTRAPASWKDVRAIVRIINLWERDRVRGWPVYVLKNKRIPFSLLLSYLLGSIFRQSILVNVYMEDTPRFGVNRGV